MQFSDIILKHRKSQVKHRKDVSLLTKSGREWSDDVMYSPIVLSNMPSCQNEKVLDIFHDLRWPYVYHRLGGIDDIYNFVKMCNDVDEYLISISVGVSDDYRKLLTKIKEENLRVDWITIDVALIYNEHFEEYISWVRKEFPKVYLIAGNFSDWECAHWLYDLGVDCGKFGIGVSELCFVGDTLVLTEKGYKYIKDVEKGDKVLTHTNTYKNVSNKIKKYSSDLISVNGQICTKEHKFYIINKVDIKKVNGDNIHEYAFWLEAKNITGEHFIVSLE